ncbi:MAG TPA: rhodanese-like domain-containing protein [Thermoanaerobaculia bacterium]|nr:rhodanese-like domain-containing protein [Thermoanaerobaculia bacterium]
MQSAIEVTRVTPEEIKTRMDRGEPIAFIDARNPRAWADSDVKLPGAIRVPADDVEKHLPEIPRDRAIVAYCT